MSPVRSILPCTERLYCIPLLTCQHAGTLPATTNTCPTPRRTTVRTKYDNSTGRIGRLYYFNVRICVNVTLKSAHHYTFLETVTDAHTALYILQCQVADSVVGITTGYELDDRGVGVRVPVG
jgi:hypothetical protein